MSAIGVKAENLIRIRDEFGFAVPAFVVVPFDEALANLPQIQNNLDELLGGKPATGTEFQSALEKLAATAKWNPQALESFYSEISSKGFGKVSFRTSAALEDLSGNSFAGQYESFLNVDFDRGTLESYVLKSFASMLTARVVQYAQAQGIERFELAGSVIVQTMFFGERCGVLFSEDGTGSLSISQVEGWQNTVVEGENSVEIRVAREHIQGGGLKPEIRQLCEQALKIEAAIGAPVDIEWSYAKGGLVLLQFRPITVRQLDYLLEWDSTNISENYPGITLPLTYSVIRQLYAGVYPAFLRMLGAPDRAFVENAAIFDNMLGYLNGHVYYRMSSWYGGLKLLPGRRNQEYFEAMLNPVKKRGAANKQKSRFDLRSLATITRFAWLLLRSERLSRGFRDQVNERIDFYSNYHLDHVNASAVMAAIKRIRAEMLSAWAVSILNDIKLMLFHGVLKKGFFGDDHHEAYLNFLQGLTDRASIKPLEALSRLGRLVNEVLQREGKADPAELRDTASWDEVEAAVKQYNREFGARTPDELKLENQRLTDSTVSLLQLASKASEATLRADNSDGDKIAWPAHISPIKRPALRYVAENTRRAIDWRERFRFNRAQTFNMTRVAYNSIAEVLVAEGLIEQGSDIFWLTEQEIDELVNGHAWEYEAKSIVERRKAKLAEHEAEDMPLAVSGAGKIAALHLNKVASNADPNSLNGNGVAPGQLTAQVVVATEFDANLDVRGKILVVHHIDPGWTLLFTQAAGIVAERGNALSHAAIIAREIGIPAIVATPNATKLLKTGDTITMNGVTGGIEIGTP